MAAINFNVSVKLSNYAKTYFELRKFDHSAEKVQLGENQVKIVNAPLMKRPTVPDADVINDVELELRMLESGKQDRQLSFSTRDLQDALERSINSTQSSSLHGKHVNLKEATMQLQNERLMRRSRSDYIFVGAFKPANV